MSNEIQIFNFQENNEIRIINQNGEPWFVAKDVCDILGLTNVTKALYALDDDEKMTLTLSKSHLGQRGGAQKINVISESGLYALILRSDKPNAKVFRKWITSEVLPALRKNGSYSMTQNNNSVEQQYSVQFAELQESISNLKLRIDYWKELNKLLQKAYDFVELKNSSTSWFGVPEYMKHDKADITFFFYLLSACKNFVDEKNKSLNDKIEGLKNAMLAN